MTVAAWQWERSLLFAGGWAGAWTPPANSSPVPNLGCLLCTVGTLTSALGAVERLDRLDRIIRGSTDPGASTQENHDKCGLPVPSHPQCGFMSLSSRKNMVDKRGGLLHQALGNSLLYTRPTWAGVSPVVSMLLIKNGCSKSSSDFSRVTVTQGCNWD